MQHVLTPLPHHISIQQLKKLGWLQKLRKSAKRKNNEALAAVHLFTPIAVRHLESSVLRPDVSCTNWHPRVRLVTNEDLEKSHFYLTQQLAVSIRQGNALSIIGTHVPYGTKDELTLLCYMICMFLCMVVLSCIMYILLQYCITFLYYNIIIIINYYLIIII